MDTKPGEVDRAKAGREPPYARWRLALAFSKEPKSVLIDN